MFTTITFCFVVFTDMRKLIRSYNNNNCNKKQGEKMGIFQGRIQKILLRRQPQIMVSTE